MKESEIIQVSKMVKVNPSRICTTCCDDSMGECDFDY